MRKIVFYVLAFILFTATAFLMPYPYGAIFNFGICTGFLLDFVYFLMVTQPEQQKQLAQIQCFIKEIETNLENVKKQKEKNEI